MIPVIACRHHRLSLSFFIYHTVRLYLRLGPSFLPASCDWAWSRPPGREHSQDTEVETEISHSPGDFLLHHAASSCFMSGGSARQLFLCCSTACASSWSPRRESVPGIHPPLRMKGPLASKCINCCFFIALVIGRGCPKSGVEGSRLAVSPVFQALLIFHSS